MASVINAQEFEEKVLQAEGLALVDFFAIWCGPCGRMAPILEEYANEQSEVAVYKVDTDKTPAVARQYGVRAVPTMILFKAGEEIGRIEGMVPKDALVARIAAFTQR